MRKWLVGIFVTAIAIFLLAISLIQPTNPKKIKLDVIEGEVLVQNGAQTVTVKANETLTASSDRLEEKQIVTAQTPTLPAPTQSIRDVTEVFSLDISFQNAIGDAVPNGVLDISGQTHRSSTSQFHLQNIPAGKHTLVARADGYREATAAIQLPGNNPISIQLEYLCDFEIAVRKGFEGMFPYPGAEVTLYAGPPVHRPVSDSIEIFKGIKLERSGNVIRVADIGREWLIQSTGTVRELGNLTSGDVFYGFQKENPMDAIHPQNDSILRMWDSLEVNHSVGSGLTSSNDVGYMLFKKDGGYLFELVASNNRFDEKKVVATAVTNNLGTCRFTGLAPAIYFAQAAWDGWQSEMRPIAPIDRTTTLCIPTKEDLCTVRIRVTKSNVAERVNNSNELNIQDADIQLKGIGNHIILSPTSNRRDYFIYNVPAGDYRLEIVPPAELKTNPPFVHKDIRVRERTSRVQVDFEANYGYTLSGTVLVEGANKPVPNFPLSLSRKSKQREDRYDPYGSMMSDAEGKFTFSFLKPGTYRISCNPLETRDTGYIHVNSGYASRSAEMEDPLIPIVDRDVSGVVFSVVPYQTINVTGTVVRDTGELVDGADVTLRDTEGRHLHSTSSKKGPFHFEIYYPSNADPIQGLLIASVSAPPLPDFRLNDDGAIVNIRQDFDNGAAEQGVLPIVLRSGDDIKDVKIVLKNADRGRAVYGKIETPEGRVPPYVKAYQIYVKQDQTNNPKVGRVLLIHGTIDEEGNYRIERLDPGPYQLRIDPENVKQKVGKTPPIPLSYAVRRIDLNMPGDVESMRRDIVLVKQSYIQGKLVDESGMPMTGVEVLARVPYEPKGWVRGGDRVDERGAFLLVVSPEEEYDLYVSDPNRYYLWYEPMLYKMKPPIDGLIFKIRSDSAKKVVD